MGKKIKAAIFRCADIFEQVDAFLAIRQGLIMMIPLIVLGALALMIKSLPIDAYQNFLQNFQDGRLVEFLDFIYSGTFQIFSVALTVATSISYGMIKNTKVQSERAVIYDCFILAIISLIALMGYMGVQRDSFSPDFLGTSNTFMALLISLGSGWMYFKIRSLRWIDGLSRKETDIGGLYYMAVYSILPAALVVGVFALCDVLYRTVFDINSLQDGLIILMEKILSLFHGNFLSGLAILFFIHIMWFFGLHGSNILHAVLTKHFEIVNGITIYSKTFQDVFVLMGGCGAALSLTIAILLFSRKKTLKNVAQLAFPGVLFNISEVIIFGLPIIFNPLFFIPFLAIPTINYLLSYGATYFGLVPAVIHQVEWTTPIFLSGYKATGSPAGAVLQLVCLIVDIAVYFPFIRMFENHSDKTLIRKVNMLVEFLQSEEETTVTTVLTKREDMLGSTARVLAGDLEDALAKKQLFLLYQPQVDKDGQCIGAEALLRWKHPIAGFIYPPLIIRLAKESGILSSLEEFIFDEAASALEALEKENDRPYKISVNITGESLKWDGFDKMIDQCVKRHHILREHLWMEITEQDALVSSIDISHRLESLKQDGHKFLIDDFGMGHTSLLYLQSNNFEVVKIDGSITRDIMENIRNQDIIKSIVYLGGLLNFTTIAEYVETEEQVALLKDLGIDAFQGYYYSKPLPLEKLIKWIK